MVGSEAGLAADGGGVDDWSISLTNIFLCVL